MNGKTALEAPITIIYHHEKQPRTDGLLHIILLLLLFIASVVVVFPVVEYIFLRMYVRMYVYLLCAQISLMYCQTDCPFLQFCKGENLRLETLVRITLYVRSVYIQNISALQMLLFAFKCIKRFNVFKIIDEHLLDCFHMIGKTKPPKLAS